MGKSPLMVQIKSLLAASRSQVDLESRRDFLKTSAKVGLLALPGATLLQSCASVQSRSIASNRKDGESQVIILGAGMAGLSSAYHLTRAGIACEIYEATGRVGGRMFTRTRFNSDGMSCELGGEFVDSIHEDIIGLCRQFGIPLVPVDSNSQDLVRNLYFFGDPGKHYFDRDALQMMRAFDRQFSRDQRAVATPEGAKRFDAMTLSEYLDRYRGRVDRWFLEMLRVAFVGECGLEANEQSALLLLWILDSKVSGGLKLFGDSDQALRIQGGNQALIGAMEQWLEKQGVVIHRWSPVENISEAGNKVRVGIGGESRRMIEAERVICTIPFSILRSIDGIDRLPMSDLKKACIRETAYATNSKLMVGYKERYWRRGAGQVPPSNGMAYTDLYPQNLWETHHDQPGSSANPKAGILTTFLGGRDGAQFGAASDTERNLAATEKVFPGIRAFAEADRVIGMNWSRSLHSLGSYASARPNQMTRFGEVGAQPELGGKLHFAGEHVAPKFSGFMNGAALSGRTVAEAILRASSKRKSA